MPQLQEGPSRRDTPLSYATKDQNLWLIQRPIVTIDSTERVLLGVFPDSSGPHVYVHSVTANLITSTQIYQFVLYRDATWSAMPSTATQFCMNYSNVGSAPGVTTTRGDGSATRSGGAEICRVFTRGEVFLPAQGLGGWLVPPGSNLTVTAQRLSGASNEKCLCQMVFEVLVE